MNDGTPHRVVIVGGGFAGLYAARHLGGTPAEVTLIDRRNFHIDVDQIKIQLVEGSDRVLPTYPASLSPKAQGSLERLGVEVHTAAMVTQVEEGRVLVQWAWSYITRKRGACLITEPRPCDG